ncbi:MAG: hypothetical protein CIT03_00760 [Methanobacterium sp.]|nr:MAG: hypothetical protein CIT03_00760 [Methanobacterium sp.]
MIVMWTFFLLSGMVPEFTTRAAEIVLHLIAEFSTAILLTIAGISLLYKKRSGYNLNLIGLGMLIYTLILSPGYYIQKEEWFMVSFFALLLILSIIFLVISLKKEYEIKLERLSSP